MYETFEHTADLGLRVRAISLESLFAEAGRGLFSMIVANLDEVRPTLEVNFEVKGQDLEYLLFDWLNELLFAFERRHLLLSQFTVRVEGGRLTAVARGEEVDPVRHQLEHEVKAITYHGLTVTKDGDDWLAEVIVDI